MSGGGRLVECLSCHRVVASARQKEPRCRECYTKDMEERAAEARAAGRKGTRHDVRAFLHRRKDRPTMEIAPGEHWSLEGDCPRCHQPVIWQSSMHYECATGRKRTVLRGSERGERHGR